MRTTLHLLFISLLAFAAGACAAPPEQPARIIIQDASGDEDSDLSARFGAYAEDNTFFSSVASNASADSTIVTVAGREACWVQILIDGTSDPVGTLQLHGYVGTSSTNAQALVLTSVIDDNDGIDFTSPSTDITVANDVGDVVAKILIPIENPPPRLFVRWTRSSGGTTGNRLNASAGCRG